MNHRPFFHIAAQARHKCPSCGNNWQPNTKRGPGRAFSWLNGLGRLVVGPGSGSVDLASGWGSDPAGLVRVLVLLARLLAGVLALLTVALVALLILLVLVWILLVCHR